MALTTLDPNTALLVVDLQKGLVGSPFNHPLGDVVGQARTLITEVFTDEERQRFIETLAGQYQALTVPAIQERFFWYWGQVDQALGEQLRALAGAPVGDAEPVGVGE